MAAPTWVGGARETRTAFWSASGFSSQAFAPHYPHTERKTETKTCSDCHVSEANDNNAIMAQLLMQGTNYMNFIGRFCWVAGGRDGCSRR